MNTCGDVDNSPPSLLDQVWHCRSRHQKRPVYIRAHDAAPNVGIDLPEGHPVPYEVVADEPHSNASVIDDGVQCAKAGESLVYNTRAIVLSSNIR
jgi:hypothetical protein